MFAEYLYCMFLIKRLNCTSLIESSNTYGPFFLIYNQIFEMERNNMDEKKKKISRLFSGCTTVSDRMKEKMSEYWRKTDNHHDQIILND